MRSVPLDNLIDDKEDMHFVNDILMDKEWVFE